MLAAVVLFGLLVALQLQSLVDEHRRPEQGWMILDSPRQDPDHDDRAPAVPTNVQR